MKRTSSTYARFNLLKTRDFLSKEEQLFTLQSVPIECVECTL